MVKICLKLSVMFVMTFVFFIGVCGADSLIENGYWFVMVCMVLVPLALFVVSCNKGWIEDVMQWSERLEKKLFGCQNKGVQAIEFAYGVRLPVMGSRTFFMICIEGENKKYESDEKKTGLVLISLKLNVEGGDFDRKRISIMSLMKKKTGLILISLKLNLKDEILIGS